MAGRSRVGVLGPSRLRGMLPAYSAPTRRRLRTVVRYGRYALRGRSRGESLIYVPTYWWDQDLNFGDLLTPVLLPELGLAPVHRPPRQAALVGVGSIVEHLPADYQGTFWGTGLMFDRAVRFPQATFAAVRGPLSAERLGLGQEVAMGDPGLLLHVISGEKRSRPQLISHFRHIGDPLWDRLARHLGRATRRVDVRHHPHAVATEIAGASVVITSSLHGLVTADAHGVPAAWTLPRPWGEGGAFKFLDYEANYGRTWERYVPVSAPPSTFVESAITSDGGRVADLRQGLISALKQHVEVSGWQQEFPGSAVPALKFHSEPRIYGSSGNSWPTGHPPVVAPQGE